MRVITGRFKYTPLASPKTNDIRPTTDRIKVDIFNILMPFIKEDGIFLDLFTGTGAIGIEAVSRGFNRAELVDSSRESLALAAQNVKKTKNEQYFRLIRSDAKAHLLATRNTYDIIFMDAPYDYKYTDELIRIIEERGLLKDTGILVVEKSSKEPEPVCSLHSHRVKKYSATKVYYYTCSSGEEEETEEDE